VGRLYSKSTIENRFAAPSYLCNKRASYVLYRHIQQDEIIGRLNSARAVLNSLFKIDGEPVVCRPCFAIGAFRRSGLEYTAMGNCMIRKYSEKSQVDEKGSKGAVFKS
jgi:hypothetical protein